MNEFWRRIALAFAVLYRGVPPCSELCRVTLFHPHNGEAYAVRFLGGSRGLGEYEPFGHEMNVSGYVIEQHRL